MNTASNLTIDLEIDASGLNCPLPILKAKKAMNELQNDQILCVISTDPGSKREFEMFAQRSKYSMLDMREEDSKTYFIMQKTKAG